LFFAVILTLSIVKGKDPCICLCLASRLCRRLFLAVILTRREATGKDPCIRLGLSS